MKSGSLPKRCNNEPIQVSWQGGRNVFGHIKVCLCSVAALGLAKEVEMKHLFSKEISLTRLPSPTPLIQHSQSEV